MIKIQAVNSYPSMFNLKKKKKKKKTCIYLPTQIVFILIAAILKSHH